MEIRLVERNDLPKLSILLQQVYIDTYGLERVSDEFSNYLNTHLSTHALKAMLLDGRHSLWVAVRNANLVGALIMEAKSSCPIGGFVGHEIHKLYILSRFCGKGIGKILMEKAEQQVKSEGEKKVWLWVLNSNQRAISFYEKLGYRSIGTAYLQLDDNAYPNLVMIKDLCQ